jgi:hypothetical protein
VVGTVSARGQNALASALHILFFVGFVPVLGVVMLPFAVETKDRLLA